MSFANLIMVGFAVYGLFVACDPLRKAWVIFYGWVTSKTTKKGD
jgi:hypothetical protein